MLSQSCLKVIPILSLSNLKYAPNLSKSCPSVVSRLSKSCLKLFQSCLQVSQSCLKVVPKLSQSLELKAKQFTRMESDHIHNPSTIRASVVPSNPYFENNGSLQMREIYGFGGNMEINIHQILVIWGCGDSYGQGSGWSPGFVSPPGRPLHHQPAAEKLTTKQNCGQETSAIMGSGHTGWTFCHTKVEI